MIIDINKQRVSSELVELFILEVNNQKYYFASTYNTSSNTVITFTDNVSPYTSRQYTPIPIEFSGYEHKSEGAYARPTVIIANVLTTFKDAVGGISNDSLVGGKITRRRTLLSNVNKVTGTIPVELPIQSFIIDRVATETPLAVTFELTTAFDLAGVTVPNRYILPNTCPWVYQGAALDKVGEKVGGCTFKLTSNNSEFPVYSGGALNMNYVTAYYDVNNGWLSDLTHAATTLYAPASGVTKNTVYHTVVTGTRNNTDGTTSSVSTYLYWQGIVTLAGTVAFNAANFRKVRLYTVWNSATTYYTYTDNRLNSCVIYDNKIWICTRSHTNQTPSYNNIYWQRIDLCGKKLSSCSARFAAKKLGNVVLVETEDTKVLPYGGFPAARRYSR